MQRIIKEGPWTFDRQFLITKILLLDMNPATTQLVHADFWVQIFDLPCGLMAERVVRGVGNYIGIFIEAGPKRLDGEWKVYIRIRVSLNLKKPLKQRMKIKKPGGEMVQNHGISYQLEGS